MKEDVFHLGIKALIRNTEGKILLLKVNPKELKGHQGKAFWDIPGGRILKGKTIEETLKREVEEETGITSIKSSKHFLTVLSNLRIPTDNGSVGLILSAYVCKVGNVGNIKISDEHIEHKWFSPKEAAELLKYKYPKEFVEKIVELK